MSEAESFTVIDLSRFQVRHPSEREIEEALTRLAKIERKGDTVVISIAYPLPQIELKDKA